MSAPLLYSERILLRRRQWWKGGGQAEHDRNICRLPLPADTGLQDPAWRCCKYWQRKLSNKWNSHLFAEAHGVATPRLYWRGRDVRAIPWSDLPEDYVIRPVLGEAGRGVLVMRHGRELLRGLRLPRMLQRAILRRKQGHACAPLNELLVEQFVEDADGGDGLPDAYKFHMFGGQIAVICVQRRPPSARWTLSRPRMTREYYHGDWTPMAEPPVEDADPRMTRPPPAAAAQMMSAAQALGRAYGTYVRVDLYLSATGPVFGEFSPTSGLRDSFHRKGDEVLGEWWQRILPDSV